MRKDADSTMDTNPTEVHRPMWRRRPGLGAIALMVTGSVLGILYVNGPAGYGAALPPMPRNAQLEADVGIRIQHVSVVANGGIVDVRYQVINPDLALKFQQDSVNPPALTINRNGKQLNRVALMKQGHTLRAGQTYYLLYYNTDGAAKHGDQMTLKVATKGLPKLPALLPALTSVPVE